MLNQKKLLLPVLWGWGLLFGWVTIAAADEAAARGWSVGYGAGSASTKAANFASAQSSNYHAAYRFEYLSSELTYSYLGRFRNDDDGFAANVRVWNLTLAAVPRYEFNSWVALEALFGVHRWQASAQVNGAHKGSDDGNDLTYGAGMWVNIRSLPIDDGLAFSLRWQRYKNVTGTDISQYVLGVHYVFH